MDVSGHSLFLLQQLNVQREFGFLCDCTVAIGNVYFKAHRAVLAAFSNYFKMIFIHQSSECIKIQPTDIQPDVFSYLLHIMYTGMGPKQPVDQGRLQDGIKFLHAYQLCRKPGEGGPDTASDTIRMSNLYGIQISSQLAGKEGAGLKAVGSRGPEVGGHSGTRAERSHGLPALAVGLEGVVPSERPPRVLRAVSSVASGDDSDISARIKQERVEDEEEDVEDHREEIRGEEERRPPGSASPTHESPCQAPGLFKDGPLALLCPRCGERCLSPEGLQEHLFSHATCALEPSGLMEDGGGEERRSQRERLDAGCLEEALRQSQALADELAAELRRGGVGGGGISGSPPASYTRKRKMACAVCNLRFSQKSQLQEHMFAHVGKPARYLRHGRFCSQLLHTCEGTADIIVPTEETARDTQDNGSSCYSLDSEVSQESVDAVPVE
ncbi:zinc finger and BTB domain-containing protein 25 [Chanos chanos]|uniref:Zinc finger and BTB domain-containing protein 25 n=1 Tax=Chanos chanos TaxID=29144 RepID=A0A6J2VAE9_CHACN|nr:zinc finger and BTB domain-containing protein 25 [Chanos chanos]